MNIIKILIPVAACVVLQTSCNKSFLEKADPLNVATDLFFKDSTQVEQAVNGVYGILQSITNSQWLYNERPSDNTTLDFNPFDRGGAGGPEQYEFWSVVSANPNIANAYNIHYSAIFNINTALEKMQTATLSDNAKNISEGQLKFLRAYLYYQLTEYFGDVILQTKALATPDEAFAYNRSPRDSVYLQIIADLNDAVSELPESYPAAQLGRATKGAALALLGRVYLTLQQWSNAQTTLSQILTLGYTLVPEYADVFDPTKKTSNTESVFAVQYYDQGNADQGEASNFAYQFSPRHSGAVVLGFEGASPSGGNIPTNNIIAAYEPGDKRKDASIGTDWVNPETGLMVPYIKKYVHPHKILGHTEDNWPVFRYSDVLLMLAEAINEQSGPSSDAYGYINQVRERAGLGDLSGLDQAAFRDTVAHERRIEVAFENWRWFDLKRTHTPETLSTFLNAYGAEERANPTTPRQNVPYSAGDYVFDAFEYYYPIPIRELQINANLKQNPGY